MAQLVEAETGGDPSRRRKWVRRSLRYLSGELEKQEHAACPMTVRRLLAEQGYSLKANLKRFTGPAHRDRDRQFEYIQTQKQTFLEAGLPIISVDTKKKELIGNFKNAGRTWCPAADEVNAHDFCQDAVGKAIPYGIYNLTHNCGHVYIGISADTPQFAVDAIAQWWKKEGQGAFPGATQLLILCDAGGSNGYRSRAWKYQLQEQMADRFGLEVIVCHYPAGASKWNPVAHRWFSHISINWAGKPMRSFESMLDYIRGTTTETGLAVKAFLVKRKYKTGVKVSNQAMKTLNLENHEVCPKWNYTIKPRRTIM